MRAAVQMGVVMTVVAAWWGWSQLLAVVVGVRLGVGVVVPLVVVAVLAALALLERHGAGAAGLVLTGTALWWLAAGTWGLLPGSGLLVSAAVALMLLPGARSGGDAGGDG